MLAMEEYDTRACAGFLLLPPPALPGSGSMGISQRQAHPREMKHSYRLELIYSSAIEGNTIRCKYFR